MRVRFIIACLLITFFTSVAASFINYNTTQANGFAELRERTSGIARLGAGLADKEALVTLLEKQKQNVPFKDVEASQEYITVYNQLNTVRQIEKSIVRYAYIITPSNTANIAKYLVDADVLTLNAKADPDLEISHFNTELKMDNYPIMRRALHEQKFLSEDNYVYDDVFKVNVFSSYAPIFASDKKTFLGLLAIDVSDKEVRAQLSSSLYDSLFMGALAIFGALLAGYILTRPSR